MRKIVCVVLVLALAAALCGCGEILGLLGGGEAASSSQQEASSTSSSRQDAADAADSSAAQASSAASPWGDGEWTAPPPPPQRTSEPAPAGVGGGVFVQSTDQTSEDGYPSVVFTTDGTFMLTVNLFEGMAHVWGSYSSTGDDGILACVVQKRDFAGFTGDDVEGFAFSILEDGTLQYFGETIGMTDEGVTFTRDDSFPTDDPAMPDVLATVTADGDGGLNLRMAPSVDSESYGLIEPGVTLEVLNMTKNYDDGEVWYQVRFDEDKIGWVAAQYTLWVRGREE